MGVDVDEPRRDDVSTRVDGAGCGALDSRRDARDRVAAHGNVAAIPRTARAVDDPGVTNQQIVGGRLRTKGGNEERGDDGGDRASAYLRGLHVPVPESRNVLPAIGMNCQSYFPFFKVIFNTPYVLLSRTSLFAALLLNS